MAKKRNKRRKTRIVLSSVKDDKHLHTHHETEPQISDVKILSRVIRQYLTRTKEVINPEVWFESKDSATIRIYFSLESFIEKYDAHGEPTLYRFMITFKKGSHNQELKNSFLEESHMVHHFSEDKMMVIIKDFINMHLHGKAIETLVENCAQLLVKEDQYHESVQIIDVQSQLGTLYDKYKGIDLMLTCIDKQRFFMPLQVKSNKFDQMDHMIHFPEVPSLVVRPHEMEYKRTIMNRMLKIVNAYHNGDIIHI